MLKSEGKRCLIGIILGYIVGSMTYFNTLKWMKNMSAATGGIHSYQISDFWNVSFITAQFEKYDYFRKENIELFIMPMMFLTIGICLSSYTFFLKQKSYSIFVAARCENEKELKKSLKEWHICSLAVYVLTFLISYHVTAYLDAPFLFRKNIVWIMLFFGISRLMILLVLEHIVFIVWNTNGEGYAFLTGMVTIVGLFLLDMLLPFIHIVLFYPQKYFIDSILFCAVIFLVSFWIYQRQKVVL